MAAYLIGIDIGTQGTKAALFDESVRSVATAFEESKLISPYPGVVWQEPEDVYASCANVIRELLDKTGVCGGDIAAIGIDGQMAGIMGIAADGSASTCYDSWLDMRCGPYMERMNERAGSRIIEISGGPATYVHGPKILWWKHEQPQAYAATAKFVPLHSYVVGRMCGLDAEHAYFDYTLLHFSCLADNAGKRWSDELTYTFDIPRDKLARIVSPFDIVGKTTAAFAALSGLPAGVPVAAGCGDTAASTFGSGMFEPDMILDIAGTASVLCSVVTSYVPDVAHATLTMMRSPVDGLFLPLAYINGGGMCLRWFRDTLTGDPPASYDTLEREAADVLPGSDGVVFIPHFSGRVLPSNRDIKGSFLGLDFMHTRGHLYRSVMEAVAYEYRYYLDVLRELYPGGHFASMLSMGGGAKSRLFNRIKADVLGVNVSTFRSGDTGILGSAVIAGVGCGLLDDYRAPINAALTHGADFAPDGGRHTAYGGPAAAYLTAIDDVTRYYKRAGIY